MIRFCAGLAAVAILSLTAAADDKKEDKKDQPIKGRWVKEADGVTVLLHFKSKDQVVVTVDGAGGKVIATCEYEADKDGVVKGKITKVEGDADNKPPEGYEFKFKFKVEKDTAMLTDFEGENSENARPIIEGEYKPKKSD